MASNKFNLIKSAGQSWDKGNIMFLVRKYTSEASRGNQPRCHGPNTKHTICSTIVRGTTTKQQAKQQAKQRQREAIYSVHGLTATIPLLTLLCFSLFIFTLHHMPVQLLPRTYIKKAAVVRRDHPQKYSFSQKVKSAKARIQQYRVYTVLYSTILSSASRNN